MGDPSLGTALVRALGPPQGPPGLDTPTQTPASPAILWLTPWLWVHRSVHHSPLRARTVAPACTGQGVTAGGSLG